MQESGINSQHREDEAPDILGHSGRHANLKASKWGNPFSMKMYGTKMPNFVHFKFPGYSPP